MRSNRSGGAGAKELGFVAAGAPAGVRKCAPPGPDTAREVGLFRFAVAG